MNSIKDAQFAQAIKNVLTKYISNVEFDVVFGVVFKFFVSKIRIGQNTMINNHFEIELKKKKR